MLGAQDIGAFAQVWIKPLGVPLPAMKVLGPTRRGSVMPLRAARRRAGAVALTLSFSLALVMATTRAAVAAPFIWDQDQNHLDDRIETVHALGYSFAFELNDTLQHKRIDV